MKPIRINNYCFDRIHAWIQYDWQIPQFMEVVIEVFYPENRNAEGLVMFNHGFLIGNDLLFYPKKILGTFTDDNPLFGINPSAYYNYSSAIVEKNWAMAFVTTSHMQFEGVPGIDIGGNPRVGQEAYAAASYLIKYGATDFFYRQEEKNRGLEIFDHSAAEKNRFMKPGCNDVIFAGHSVGGAQAQAAACGFETLQELGRKSYRLFDPVIYDREFLPEYSERMSKWQPHERANPVGLLQLSPVDQKILGPLIPGMQLYREALASKKLPILMIVGQYDCACLNSKNSNPPAWSNTPGDTNTQFAQLAPQGSNSWAVVANVARGSHSGYLTEVSDLCNMADSPKSCPAGVGKDTYQSCGEESLFTNELFKRFIDLYPSPGGFQGDLSNWIQSDFIQWLNKENPFGGLKLLPMAGGGYIDYAGKLSSRTLPHSSPKS
jgi:hypothetical protein